MGSAVCADRFSEQGSTAASWEFRRIKSTYLGPSDFTAPEMSSDAGLLAPVGGPVQEHLDLAQSASPIYYIHADEPSMLVIHGTAGHLVPFLQSERLVDAMEKAGARFYFHTVVGAGHNPYFGLSISTLPEPTSKGLEAVSACLKTQWLNL
jgi:fermentation-respiration switch protein FrsA (DUF1100 family)